MVKVSTTATPGTAASSLGKAEDAAHASSDVGIAILAKRTDTAAVSGQTDGDYSTVNVDASGLVWTHPGAWPLNSALFEVTTATIADSASLSGAVDLSSNKGTLVAIQTPAGWTTAVITFQASYDGSTWCNLYNASGVEVATGSIVASYYVALDPADFAGIRYLKVRSGTAAAAVAQAGGDTLQLVLRAV